MNDQKAPIGSPPLPDSPQELERLLRLVDEFVAASRKQFDQYDEAQSRFCEALRLLAAGETPEAHRSRPIKKLPAIFAGIVPYVTFTDEEAGAGFLEPIVRGVIEGVIVSAPDDAAACSMYEFASSSLGLAPLTKPADPLNRLEAVCNTWKRYVALSETALRPYEDLARRIRQKFGAVPAD
jgi:hypothetical protein